MNNAALLTLIRSTQEFLDKPEEPMASFAPTTPAKEPGEPKQVVVMLCHYCETEQDATAKTCNHCGAPLVEKNKKIYAAY